jgi:hypothetical protein
MTLEELEAVRLVDLLDLDQGEAAFYMGISRKAFWNDLMNARRKIAAALVYGMGLRIEGGSYVLRGGDESSGATEVSRKNDMALMEMELEQLRSRLEYLSAKVTAFKETDASDNEQKTVS